MLDDLEIEEISDFEAKLHQNLRANNSSLLDIITTKGALSKEENKELADAMKQFTKDYVSNRGSVAAVKPSEGSEPVAANA